VTGESGDRAGEAVNDDVPYIVCVGGDVTDEEDGEGAEKVSCIKIADDRGEDDMPPLCSTRRVFDTCPIVIGLPATEWSSLKASKDG